MMCYLVNLSMHKHRPLSVCVVYIPVVEYCVVLPVVEYSVGSEIMYYVLTSSLEFYCYI